MEIEVTIFQDLEFWINENFIMAMEKFWSFCLGK